ncbi:MAG: hypothetical protein MZV70_28640 [Desulfobacterales bacterium]|nr:hypothetical protein [Desulfobacterales bacterium]
MRNIWIDLVSPGAEEISQVKKHLSIEIPSQAEMQEIEDTSRLYQENRAYHEGATAQPGARQHGVLVAHHLIPETYLVTVRYLNPKPFDTFATRIQKPAATAHPAPTS